MKNYNKIILYFGLFFFVAGSFTSCSDYLDIKSGSTTDPDLAYQNFTNFQGFTEELYHCIPSFNNRDDNNFFNNGEEEMWQANAANQGAWIWQVDLGNFLAWQRGGFGNGGSFLDQNDVDFSTNNTNNQKRSKSLWVGSWYGIRKANIGLANLDKMVDATQEEKDIIAGQLYFFRAWFHMQIISYWGGMPYIDSVLASDEPLRFPRLTYQQTADKIAEDFTKASTLLPSDWDAVPAGQATLGKNELRINKWMAFAYLGKNYLYAGSPLMNKSSGGGEQYNAEYCKKAAEAFGTLLNASENGSCQYKLIPWGTNGTSYEQVYRTNGQNGRMPGSAVVNGVTYLEAIFRGPNYGGTGQSMDKQYLCANVLQGRSWSQYPTANYVNYFGTNTGYPINSASKADVPGDQGSNYDINYPWKNRDPRFYLNFGFDTRKMVNSTATAEARQYTYANLYDGVRVGNYRSSRASGSNTGYLLMKFNPLGLNRYDNAYNNHQVHIPWLRLSDVYLMYAESIAMGHNNIRATATTWNKDAVYAIDKVRNRVILPNGNPLPGVQAPFLVSTDMFMSEVRRERAVELAYEGHRFNDLRRWLLLTKFPYNVKTGITFDRDVPETNDVNPTNNFLDKVNPENNKINNLKESVVWERIYSDKHYWLPLKRADVSIYPEFYQNPGW
ncbi:RagB/SusD family nutrient uptake outer membrane protein [Flavobacterium eburneipallidum]|uniref:RagB/SusD family nutrient uptake outer membrane protein n=1 Tax=Flavobacterium eburneipallidum TaxID=3003263 RepID=UPI002482C08F|nr:RagB/SusD family nutrient uptake outer membrane protein [Flavobacterium eburneipallidum]